MAGVVGEHGRVPTAGTFGARAIAWLERHSPLSGEQPVVPGKLELLADTSLGSSPGQSG